MLTKAETHQMDLGANQEDSQKAEEQKAYCKKRSGYQNSFMTACHTST
jgi:hypothetical protein